MVRAHAAQEVQKRRSVIGYTMIWPDGEVELLDFTPVLISLHFLITAALLQSKENESTKFSKFQMLP